jgi:hypothetical protein
MAMRSVARRRVLAWLGAVAASSFCWAERNDAVASVVEALVSSRNFKVRAHAATLLARLDDPRALTALIGATVDDPHPAVRGAAVRLLARVARRDLASAQRVRPVIGRGMSDRDPSVRRQAGAALAALERSFPVTPPPPPGRSTGTVVALGTMADRTGHASRAFLERVRAQMLSLLQRESRIQVAALNAPGVGFIVDGTIARLQVGQNGPGLEAICAIELVVSRPPHGIVTIASGEATVEIPRARFHQMTADRMQGEALDGAIRSAHDSLIQFLRAQ